MLILPRNYCRLARQNNGLLQLHFTVADDHATQPEDVFFNVLPREARFEVGAHYWIEVRLAAPR